MAPARRCSASRPRLTHRIGSLVTKREPTSRGSLTWLLSAFTVLATLVGDIATRQVVGAVEDGKAAFGSRQSRRLTWPPARNRWLIYVRIWTMSKSGRKGAADRASKGAQCGEFHRRRPGPSRPPALRSS